MITVYAKGQTVEVIDGAPVAPTASSGPGAVTVYAKGQTVEVLDIVPNEPFFPPDVRLGNSATPIKDQTSYRVWTGLGVKTGIGAVDFNAGQALEWDNLNGDWLDRNGVKQGAAPWYVATIPKLHTGEFRIDITELAQRWHAGENRGLYWAVLPPTSQSAWATVAGTHSTTPPRLVLTGANGGVVTLRGDLAHSQYAKATASTPPSRYDSSLSVKMSRLVWGLLHFDGLKDAAAFIRAEVVLTVTAADDVYATPVTLFEADPPPLLMGGAGMAPTPGLAVEVGSEEALVGHPDVWAAGDFREENWNAEPGIWRDQTLTGGAYSKPAKLFTGVSMNKAQWLKTECVPDPGHPGRYALKTCIAEGNIGGGEFYVQLPVIADMADPARPMRRDRIVDELYSRVEVYLDPSSFWSRLYAFKFSPVGLDLRMGLWDDGAGWNSKGGSAYSFGNGQTSADGRKYFSTEYGQWYYKGHSIRGHLLGHPHPEYAAYQQSVGLGFAPSHLGPYDMLWDGGLYGTEQNFRMFVLDPQGQKHKRQHVIPKGRWVTMESYVKLNSVDTSTVDANGNGSAINDGVLRVWMDGVLCGERTGLAWRRHPEMTIKGDWLMQYHGGSTATDHDIWIWYRNKVVAKRYIGPSARLWAARMA